MTRREHGAVAGGAIGAGSGALIGSASGNTLEGALIGGAVGAVAGAIIGDSVEARQQRAARDRALAEQLRSQDLDARQSERGVVVSLPDVLFQFGRAELSPNARRKVSNIARVVNGPEAAWRNISVEGHTDAIGGEQANQVLSEKRAIAVADSLVGLGVQTNRISTQGLGEAYPVAANQLRDGSDNPQGRAQNRRVEVVILSEAAQGVQPQPVYAPQQGYAPQPGYGPPGSYPPSGGYPSGGYPPQGPPMGYPQGPPPYGY
ncbi:MAG: OmpA family protein [Candidatus Binatia bacterium]